MILPGSYTNGFAPRDGFPLYPSLWRGCVGSWAPCLGPTGLTLRDWSGYGRHGTLTGMDPATDWVVNEGRYTLDFDATNDYVACGTIPELNGASAASLTGWIYRASTGATVAFGAAAGDVSAGNKLSCIWFSDGNIYTNASAASVSYGVCALTGVGWHHIAIVFNGSGAGNSTRLRVYIDGVLKTLSFSGTIPATLGTITPEFTFGRDATNRYSGGNIDDVSAFSRGITESEIRLRCRQRGIAFAMPVRRTASVQVAASFNRRRRLLVGAG